MIDNVLYGCNFYLRDFLFPLWKGGARIFFLDGLVEISIIKSYVLFLSYIKLYNNQYKRTTMEYKQFSKS